MQRRTFVKSFTLFELLSNHLIFLSKMILLKIITFFTLKSSYSFYSFTRQIFTLLLTIKWVIELDGFYIFPPSMTFYGYLFSPQEYYLYSLFLPKYWLSSTQNPNTSCGSWGLPEAQIISHTPWRTGALMEGSLWFTFEYEQLWYGNFFGENVSFLSTCWNLDL